MKCSNCEHDNAVDAKYCAKCSNSLSIVTEGVNSSSQSSPSTAGAAPGTSPTPNTAPNHTQSTTPTYTSPPVYNTASARPTPYTYQQPYYSPAPVRQKQPFSITDAYIIIGFILSIIGIFTYAFILLPAGIGFSIIGFVRRTNARTLGLSVAGIVIGVVACFIRVGMLLNELGFIPDWLSSGIF